MSLSAASAVSWCHEHHIRWATRWPVWWTSWDVPALTSVSLGCRHRGSGGVIAGGSRRQSEAATGGAQRMGICSERAWPASQCREHERRLAAETLELATVGPYGCIVGVGAGECTSAIEPIPSCVCACGGCEKVGAGLAFSGHHCMQHERWFQKGLLWVESRSPTAEKGKASARAASGSLQCLCPVSGREDGQRGFTCSRGRICTDFSKRSIGVTGYWQ